MRALIVIGLLSVAPNAAAQSIWNSPQRQPRYTVELEPHLVLGPFSPPGDGSGSGVGPGIRASIPLSREGFLPAYNDSVALGVGLDWVFYHGPTRRGACTRFVTAPGGADVCVEVDGQGGDSQYFFVPLVMQWNFFLHERVSLFFEPGVDLYLRQNEFDKVKAGVGVNVQVGGRFMITDRFEAVLRLGYPTVTLGVGVLL
jgi:hypothetical protein